MRSTTDYTDDKTKVTTGSLSDSGFVSDRSMRGCLIVDAELGESLIRSLGAKHGSINDFEARGKVHQRRNDMIVETSNRLQVKWTDLHIFGHTEDVLNNSYEYFFKQDSDGDTQLHISIAMNHLEASLWLIGLAPHPSVLDISNDESQTPLHLAVMMREPRIVRRLVLAGANSKLRTRAGNTPLHIACALGDLACTKALTEPLTHHERTWTDDLLPPFSLNLELRNYVGKTCLHIAASKGHVDLVNHLVRSGANVATQEGLGGKTALHLAVENGCKQVVHLLAQEERTCLNAVTYAGTTAYQIAVEVDRQLADDLLDLGASADFEYSESSSGTDSSSDDEPDVFSPHVSAFSRMGLAATAVTA